LCSPTCRAPVAMRAGGDAGSSHVTALRSLVHSLGAHPSRDRSARILIWIKHHAYGLFLSSVRQVMRRGTSRRVPPGRRRYSPRKDFAEKCRVSRLRRFETICLAAGVNESR